MTDQRDPMKVLEDILRRNASTMLLTDGEWLAETMSTLTQTNRAQRHVIEHLLHQPRVLMEVWSMHIQAQILTPKLEELLESAGADVRALYRVWRQTTDPLEAGILARVGTQMVEAAHKAIGSRALDPLSVSGLPVAVL